MRPRREVSARVLWWLRLFFRRCWTRDAWILRVVGNRRGPVLVLAPPERSEDPSRKGGRFTRPRQRTGELGEDGEVGAEPHALQDPGRSS